MDEFRQHDGRSDAIGVRYRNGAGDSPQLANGDLFEVRLLLRPQDDLWFPDGALEEVTGVVEPAQPGGSVLRANGLVAWCHPVEREPGPLSARLWFAVDHDLDAPQSMPTTTGRIRRLCLVHVPFATSGLPVGGIALRGVRSSQDDRDDLGSVYVRDAPLDADVRWRRRGWLATVDLHP